MTELFVSDLHLDGQSVAANERFLAFLAQEARQARVLYILGDLFEAWIGDDDPDPAKARICAGLRQLTDHGVGCFVLHGNRDFLLGAQFAARTGCRLLPDPVIATFDSEAVLLTHGDALCVDDHSYQELRSTVREPAWQQRFLGLALPTRELLAHQARRGSQAHTARTVPYVMDVSAAAVDALWRTGVSRIVHGHTHRPGIHAATFEGRAVERIVLGAWYEQGSYLRRDQGRYELRELD
ncbi:MAG TPA: UDP-2,3-diacylglucosamine diphosphatase [Steroidobacteraceae bacterium]|nr:UDP-2,3-diacylglucosamine diphosphatase [Steroidobacteraceae bacterium]